MKDISFKSFMETMDLLTTGIVVVDFDGKIIFWNNGVELITDISDKDALEENFDDLLEIYDVYGKKMYFSNVKLLVSEPKKSTALEAWVQKSSRTLTHIRLFAAKLYDNSGNDYGIAMVIHDVSIEEILGEALEDSFNKINVDTLTMLYSKEALMKDIEVGIDNLKRKGYKFGVVFIDIDNFKQINDKCGHILGDKTLKAFGKILRNKTRKGERAYRFGGDEFVILLFLESELEAETYIERIKEEVSKIIEPVKFEITAGFTLADERDTPDSLLNRADILMYDLKRKKQLKR